MKKKYSYLSNNVKLFTISSFGQKILSFLLVPLYTSYLNTQEYGIIDLVATTINIIIPIFSLNIAEGIMRFTLEEKNSKDYLAYGILVAKKGALILALFGVVLSFIPMMSEYRIYFPWMFVGFIFNLIYSISQNYLRAIDRIPIMIIASLINTVVMLTADIFFIVIMKWGFCGYYFALFLGLLVSTLFMQFNENIFTGIRLKSLQKNELNKQMLSYCIPTVFTGMAWWINSSLDKYFVTGICGVSQNGIYSVAYRIPTILGVFQTIFTQAWSISAVVDFDEKDTDGFFTKTYELYNAGMVLITSIIMIFNIFLSKILYANKFYQAWYYVPVLLYATLFSAMAGYLGGIFSAVKDTKTCAYSTFVSAGVNIVLNTLLIGRIGILGAAISTAIAYFISWLIRLIVSAKYIKMSIDWKKSILVYWLLIIQLICAMSPSHIYLLQIVILILIICTYKKYYMSLLLKLLKYIKKYK